MEKPFKYGYPLLFRAPAWVKLPSDADVSVQIKPLPYSTISAAQDSHYLSQQTTEYFNPSTYHTILENAVIDTQNAIGFPSIKLFLQQLSKNDLRYLYNRLMELSTISRLQLDELNMMLEIQFNPQFQEDSWNCSVCQAKKLDYNRACGYLPEDKRDPAPILPRVGERRFLVCPISTIDIHVINQASMAHNLMTAGLLPEDGGINAQTEWFVKVALLYKRKIAEAERNQMEASRNKRK